MVPVFSGGKPGHVLGGSRANSSMILRGKGEAEERAVGETVTFLGRGWRRWQWGGFSCVWEYIREGGWFLDGGAASRNLIKEVEELEAARSSLDLERPALVKGGADNETSRRRCVEGCKMGTEIVDYWQG